MTHTQAPVGLSLFPLLEHGGLVVLHGEICEPGIYTVYDVM